MSTRTGTRQDVRASIEGSAAPERESRCTFRVPLHTQALACSLLFQGDVSHDRTVEQGKFLTRIARQWAGRWRASIEARAQSQEPTRELTLCTAYSGYRVKNERCVEVRRHDPHTGMFTIVPLHEGRDAYLVGYLSEERSSDGSWRFTLHRSARAQSKAVFWRPHASGHGDFIVTSRLKSMYFAPNPTAPRATTPRVSREVFTPTGVRAPAGPPPLPARRSPGDRRPALRRIAPAPPRIPRDLAPSSNANP